MFHRARGFTLVELVIASAMGIILVMGIVGFAGKLQSQVSGLNLEQVSLEELQGADLALTDSSNCNKFFLGKSFTNNAIDITAALKAEIQSAAGSRLFSKRVALDQARLTTVGNHPSLALLHVEFHLSDNKPHVQDLPVYYDLDQSFRISTCSSSPIDSTSALTCP